MWDNAPMLRSISSLLYGISFALMLFGAVHYVLHLPIFTLGVVQLKSAPDRVPTELIRKIAQEKIQGNFFTVDLANTRALFEHLPWVRKVSVRRVFPWGLEVQLEEQIALARWNGNSLVNIYGEVFLEKTDQLLPNFVGQPDTSVPITNMYSDLRTKLLPIKQDITQISLSPRFAWQVRLSNGMILELGREQMEQRLERFVSVYPYSISKEKQTVMHVDLRYRNGFAAYLPNGMENNGKQYSENKV